MKTGDIQQFLQLHRETGDIQPREINLTTEQVKAIKYLAKDQGESFEDMAMTLIQYQLQLIQAQVDIGINGQARLN